MTLASIARSLGVSPATVSNAYNRPHKLSAALREQILDAALELGYAGPNVVAQSLRSGRAGAIGVLLTDSLEYAFADPGAREFLGGLGAQCAAASMALTLVTAGAEGDSEMVRRALVDGFALFALPEQHPLLAPILRRGLPVVTHGSPMLGDHPFVGIDDHAAAASAARHLIEQGHRRVAVITFRLGPDEREGPAVLARRERATWRITRHRLMGYADALEIAAIAWRDVAVIEQPLNDRASGERAAHRLLDSDPELTAILATSDELAVGALLAAQQRSLDVPRDLSIVGFDDTPAAVAALPQLTTVSQDLRSQGAHVARLLIDGDTQGGTHLHPWTLVVRDSSGPAAR